jgi:hypothetical protein
MDLCLRNRGGQRRSRWKLLLAASIATVLVLSLGMGLIWFVARTTYTRTVKGRVVDHAGVPISGVTVSHFWNVSNGRMKAFEKATTDSYGTFEASIPFYGKPAALFAIDSQRNQGAIAVITSDNVGSGLTMKLSDLSMVRGQFTCEELGHLPLWTNAYVYVLPEKVRIARCDSEAAQFAFKLPSGQYRLYAYGTDVQNVYREISLTDEEADHDLGTLDMEATIIARHYGKKPPAWRITEASGLNPNTTLSDFQGKWVLLEFWDYG